MKCQKCTYTWEPRKDNPKECPRCKTRLDYTPVAERQEEALTIGGIR